MCTGIPDVENHPVFVHFKYQKLCQCRCCGSGMIFPFSFSAEAFQTVLFKILSAEGSQATHMDEGIRILFSTGILLVQVVPERHILFIEMQNRTG